MTLVTSAILDFSIFVVGETMNDVNGNLKATHNEPITVQDVTCTA